MTDCAHGKWRFEGEPPDVVLVCAACDAPCPEDDEPVTAEDLAAIARPRGPLMTAAEVRAALITRTP